LAHAGAWLQKENGGIFLSQYRQYYTEEYFDKNGEKYSDFAFYKAEYNPYGEYGVTDWLTVGGSANIQAIINRDTMNNQNTDLYLNNIEAFFRLPLYAQGAFVSSIEPRAYIPIDSSLSINPDGNRIMPELKLSFGYDLGEGDYIDASILYIKRTDDGLDDMVKTEISYNYKITDEFAVLTQYTDENSRGDISANNDKNYDLEKLGLNLVWDKYKRMSYQIGVTYDINGRNTGSGIGVNYSVGYKF
jgi:hypothetical protein